MRPSDIESRRVSFWDNESADAPAAARRSTEEPPKPAPKRSVWHRASLDRASESFGLQSFNYGGRVARAWAIVEGHRLGSSTLRPLSRMVAAVRTLISPQSQIAPVSFGERVQMGPQGIDRLVIHPSNSLKWLFDLLVSLSGLEGGREDAVRAGHRG